MLSEKFFPTVIIILMFLAGVVYLYNGDWRRAVYFIAAGVLNLVVVY